MILSALLNIITLNLYNHALWHVHCTDTLMIDAIAEQARNETKILSARAKRAYKVQNPCLLLPSSEPQLGCASS